ncbi:hypothetical protein PRZ48_002714 [Zasmidium cellare]|uniref:N-acetyltransferase domain-containing protein n=1 Tax=Zasmidium cellare TaxID=395010 RepID=A0ABR0ET12_ZASCE|nr:hypothetical protein PRZ48_002714 [Zasmidium cellare]
MSKAATVNTRPATYADLVPAAKCLARAFKDEPMHGDVLHPHRKEYPDDMYLFFLHNLRIQYVSGPDVHLHVSTTTDSTGKEVITGLSQWRRLRAKPHQSLYTATMVKAMQRYNSLESLIYPNRALDPSKVSILGEMWPFMAHHWTGTRAEVWDLSTLGVDPAYSKQGIGRELVKWGFEQAKREGVGCSVISSEGNERFYERCGFDVVVGTAGEFGGEANPGREIAGGTIHFWDNGVEPKGVKKYGEV